MEDFWDEYAPIILVAIGLIIFLAFMIALVNYSIANHNKWVEFKASHQCKLIAQTDGRWIYGSGYNTSGHYSTNSFYDEGSKTYKCDDGVTYTKGEND